jgi:hypothetical protein
VIKTTPVEQILGLHNTQRPELCPPWSLSDCSNVYVTDAGRIERREGFSRVVALTNATDLFTPIGHEGLFVVADTALISYADDYTPTVIQANLTDAAFSWDELGDRVFYAGATDCGVIVDRLNWQPLRIPVPDATVLTGSGSSYSAGQYQVCATFTHDASGVEGPASPVEAVDLAEGELMSVQVAPVSGYTANVYISEPDGGVPLGTYGEPVTFEQRDSQPFPENVTAITAQGGVLYAAVYDATNDLGFLFWSQPFFHTCWRLATDYIAVPGKILQTVKTDAGLLLATDKSIWVFDGDNLKAVADYGGVAGQSIAQDREGNTMLWTQRGVCTFDAEGFKNVTHGKLSVPPGSRCSTSIVENQGTTRFIAITDGAGTAANPYTSVAGSCWCTNMHNGETTKFDDFGFLAMGYMHNKSYGLTPNGVYQLGGTTDAGAKISANFRFNPVNFGTMQRKRVPYIYVDNDAQVEVSTSVDDIPVGSFTGMKRIRLARGAIGQFFAFDIANLGGDEFRIKNIELLVEPTSRRI